MTHFPFCHEGLVGYNDGSMLNNNATGCARLTRFCANVVHSGGMAPDDLVQISQAFQPMTASFFGEPGFTTQERSGKVISVVDGSQAMVAGVEASMTLALINNVPYSSHRFREAVHGPLGWRAVFFKKQPKVSTGVSTFSTAVGTVVEVAQNEPGSQCMIGKTGTVVDFRGGGMVQVDFGFGVFLCTESQLRVSQ